MATQTNSAFIIHGITHPSPPTQTLKVAGYGNHVDSLRQRPSRNLIKPTKSLQLLT
jgi:hypothetical protein